MPEAAITTDIVGLPGVMEQDFQGTRCRRRVAFASAFTFQYSIRPRTPAATMPDQVPKARGPEMHERLVALVEELVGEQAPRGRWR